MHRSNAGVRLPLARLCAWLGLVLAASCATAGCTCGGAGRAPIPPGPAERHGIRELELFELPTERTQHLSDVLGDGELSLVDGVRRLHRFENDRCVHGVFVRLGAMPLAWGRIDELSHALGRVRAAGRPVHCHANDISEGTLVLASEACTTLTLEPAGSVQFAGVRIHGVYLRDLLDRLGVRAELVQAGAAKGAADTFVRSRPSEEQERAMQALVSDWYELLSRTFRPRTTIKAGSVESAMNQGLFSATQAKERGLVDAVEFSDVALERFANSLARLPSDCRTEAPTDSRSFARWWRLLRGADHDALPSASHVQLLHLSGTIRSGHADDALGKGAATLVSRLDALTRASQVRAVVLRIDSPGGSALAGDEIWRAIRRLSGKKPVVVSVGDMAASGGYYIASAATSVLAHPGSIIGSIGVVGGKVDVSTLSERLGVHVAVWARGNHADWDSPFRPFNDAERVTLNTLLEDTHWRFIARIAEGRKRPVAQVKALADGRLMTGERAYAAGLVDALGTLRDALRVARELAGVPATTPVIDWPSAQFDLSTLRSALTTGAFMPASASPLAASVLAPSALAILDSVLAPLVQDAELVVLAPGVLISAGSR